MAERVIIYQLFTRLFGNTNLTNKPWGTLEENGVGKFNDITKKALAEIKNMGFTHVWYTGVIEHALLTDYTAYGIPLDDADVVKGRAGSPYAIKDYYDVNPDLAKSVPERMAEFEDLIERTHQAGLRLIIDFVPNHVARSYHSDAKPNGTKDLGEDDDPNIAFHEDNNFYYIPGEAFQVPEEYNPLGPYDFPTKDGYFEEIPAKATGNDVFSATPTINDWFETVKLNYGIDYLDGHKTYFRLIPDTWRKMREILLFWASKKVDAFRCDMAEMVPLEFWDWVIMEVKNEYPDMQFIAEIYRPENYRDYLFTGGFDYLYDKVEMYDTLKNIIRGHASTDNLPAVWQSQEGISQFMLRFLENHDEQRIASPEFAGDMKKGIPLMATAAFMNTGPVMIYFGQEVGEPAKGASGFSGDDGRTTIFDYWGVPEHVKWVNEGAFDGAKLSAEQKHVRAGYIKIMKACNSYPALRNGAFFDLHYFNRKPEHTGYSNQIYAFLRHSEKQVLLTVINFAESSEKIQLEIPKDFWSKIGWKSTHAQLIKQEEAIATEVDKVAMNQLNEKIHFEIAPLSYQIFEVVD